MDASTETVSIGGADLTVATWGSGVPEIVMLHDGLGSIAQWRGVPESLAAATGLTVMAYDRAGHGESLPQPTGAWPADWLHREADVLARLLDERGAVQPHLVGHSDGGSIAAIYAMNNPVKSMVLLAGHSWVEEKTSGAIAAMRANPGPVTIGLARSHNAPAALFGAWSAVWVGDEFARWDIRADLAKIAAPTVVAQGAEDEYALPTHASSTAHAIGGNAAAVLLDGLGHLLHHQAPDTVVELIAHHIEVHG